MRVTAFVEIGPVVALRATTFAQLLPFPDLRMGWGLDAHWAAVARAHGWRMGIVDALPVTHLLRPVADRVLSGTVLRSPEARTQEVEGTTCYGLDLTLGFSGVPAASGAATPSG